MFSDAIRSAQLALSHTDTHVAQRAAHRWDTKTKPPGSLGQLEALVIKLATLQQSPDPHLSRTAMFVFCADHGVANEGVSAYPQAVTGQMVANFLAGGAAINVLCQSHGITPRIVDCGVATGPSVGTINCWIGSGTRNFAREPAMTPGQCESALSNGFRLAEAAKRDFHAVAIGEMGIANTTSAAALFAALSGLPVEDCVGRGTGIDDRTLARKRAVVEAALALHRDALQTPAGALACVGGFEIATMTGFLVGCIAHRLPVFIDGFIAGAAAACANAMVPQAVTHFLFSHASAERGHRALLQFLNVRPLLDLDLRLGEGTGAALAIGLAQTALSLYRDMATFESAGVSQRGA